MKKEDEVVKSAREASVLLQEAREIFQRTFQTYADAVKEDIQRCVDAIMQNRRDLAVEDELVALISSLKEPMVAIRKHNIQMRRGLKIVHHKNAVHANDRLFAILERMKKETKVFEDKIAALPKPKARNK